MPSIPSSSTIPPAQAARFSSQQYANGTATNSELALVQAVSVALNTAIAAGLFSASASASGYGQLLINDVLLMLTNMGYTVSYSGTTITFMW